MNALTLVEKRCSRCGETKPASAFGRDKGASDGLRSWCKPCTNAAAKDYQQRRRTEMGEEAWREYQRGVVRASRENTGDVANRLGKVARNAAERVLRERHRAEFDQLVREERYKLGLPNRAIAKKSA